MNKLKIGLIGLGTVGTGVYKSLQKFDNVEIVKVAVKNINKPRSVDIKKELLTDNPYDVAIEGHGYIPVTSEDGEVQYTRDGSLKRGANGYLVTFDDWMVGDGIKIPANSYKFEIVYLYSAVLGPSIP